MTSRLAVVGRMTMRGRLHCTFKLLALKALRYERRGRSLMSMNALLNVQCSAKVHVLAVFVNSAACHVSIASCQQGAVDLQ